MRLEAPMVPATLYRPHMSDRLRSAYLKVVLRRERHEGRRTGDVRALSRPTDWSDLGGVRELRTRVCEFGSRPASRLPGWGSR